MKQEALERCADVEVASYPHPVDLHLQAAMSGNTRSTRDTLSFSAAYGFAVLVNEPHLAQIYHQNFVPVLMQTLASADVQALRAWQWLLQMGPDAPLCSSYRWTCATHRCCSTCRLASHRKRVVTSSRPGKHLPSTPIPSSYRAMPDRRFFQSDSRNDVGADDARE